MTRDYDFLYEGGNMDIPKLEICPKCKGHLMLEKDNFGAYQQCLQCGYLHDLQTFPSIEIEQTEDEKESKIPHHVLATGSPTILQNTAQLQDGTRSTALADQSDFQIILDVLNKRRQDNH